MRVVVVVMGLMVRMGRTRVMTAPRVVPVVMVVMRVLVVMGVMLVRAGCCWCCRAMAVMVPGVRVDRVVTRAGPVMAGRVVMGMR